MDNNCFTREKVSVYIFSLFLSGGLTGLFGVVSRIKKPMSDEFHFQESFLGIFDSVLFAGSMFGFVYLLLFTPKKLIIASFICAICGILSLQLLYVSSLTSFPAVLIVLGMFGFGFTRSFATVHLTIINHHFREGECDKFAAQIWFSLIRLGDVAGILGIDFLIRYLHIYWGYSLSIILAFFAIVSILFMIFIKQIELPPQENQDQSICAQLRANVTQYLGKTTNLLHAIQYIFLMATYHIILIWLPFYFLKSGFTSQAAWIAIIYPIGFLVGTLFFNPILKFFSRFYSIVMITFLVLYTLSSFLLSQLGNDPSQIPIYIVGVSCVSFFSSGVTARMTTSEISIRTTGTRKYFLALSQVRFIIRAILVPTGVITGVLMQTHLQNLFYILLAFACISTFTFIVRWILYPEQMQMQTEKPKQPQKINEEESEHM